MTVLPAPRELARLQNGPVYRSSTKLVHIHEILTSFHSDMRFIFNWNLNSHPSSYTHLLILISN